MDEASKLLLLAEIAKLSQRFDELGKRMDARFAKWAQQPASPSPTSTTASSPAAADNWGGLFDGGDDPDEQQYEAPPIVADNWGGLFDGGDDAAISNTASAESVYLHDLAPPRPVNLDALPFVLALDAAAMAVSPIRIQEHEGDLVEMEVDKFIERSLAAPCPRRASPYSPRARRPCRPPLRVPRLRQPRRAPPRPPRPRRPRRASPRRRGRPPWFLVRVRRCRTRFRLRARTQRAPLCLPWLHQPQLAARSVCFDSTTLQELVPLPPGEAQAAEGMSDFRVFILVGDISKLKPVCAAISSALSPAVPPAEKVTPTNMPARCSTNGPSRGTDEVEFQKKLIIGMLNPISSTTNLPSRYISINSVASLSGVPLHCASEIHKASEVLLVEMISHISVLLEPWFAHVFDSGPWSPPLENKNKLVSHTIQLHFCFGLSLNCGQEVVKHRPPWPPPIQLQRQGTVIQLRPIAWPSFGCHRIVVQPGTLLSLKLSFSYITYIMSLLAMSGQHTIEYIADTSMLMGYSSSCVFDRGKSRIDRFTLSVVLSVVHLGCAANGIAQSPSSWQSFICCLADGQLRQQWFSWVQLTCVILFVSKACNSNSKRLMAIFLRCPFWSVNCTSCQHHKKDRNFVLWIPWKFSWLFSVLVSCSPNVLAVVAVITRAHMLLQFCLSRFPFVLRWPDISHISCVQFLFSWHRPKSFHSDDDIFRWPPIQILSGSVHLHNGSELKASVPIQCEVLVDGVLNRSRSRNCEYSSDSRTAIAQLYRCKFQYVTAMNFGHTTVHQYLQLSGVTCPTIIFTQHMTLWDPGGESYFLDGCKFLNCLIELKEKQIVLFSVKISWEPCTQFLKQIKFSCTNAGSNTGWSASHISLSSLQAIQLYYGFRSSAYISIDLAHVGTYGWTKVRFHNCSLLDLWLDNAEILLQHMLDSIAHMSMFSIAIIQVQTYGIGPYLLGAGFYLCNTWHLLLSNPLHQIVLNIDKCCETYRFSVDDPCSFDEYTSLAMGFKLKIKQVLFMISDFWRLSFCPIQFYHQVVDDP